MRKFICVAIGGVILASLMCLTSTTLAQENQDLGRMWTFENPPLAYLKKEYGFEADQEWLNSLRLGTLRLGGENIQSSFGSASFVSPKGLILTSGRCVRDAVAATRARGPSVVEKGFVAGALAEETRLRSNRSEWLTAIQLNKISDVTSDVNAGIRLADNETRVKEIREANKKTILDAARNADPRLAPYIVSLHPSGAFKLYQYKVFNDVRLVCVPHLQAARFGGDSDNFAFPRYSLDFAFLRAYENGYPADTTKHYFQWKLGGAKKDELVFVSGNPGTTKRLFTKAQLEFERDIRLPIEIDRLKNVLRIWKENLNPTWHDWPQFRNTILRTEDDLKIAIGKLDGLKNTVLMEQKTVAERSFRARVMADKKLAEKYGDLWDRIESLVNEQRLHEARATFQSTGGRTLLDTAVDIVRFSDPAETSEVRDRSQKKLQKWKGGIIQYNFFGRTFFVDFLSRAHHWLPPDDPFFTKVLGGKNGPEFLDTISPFDSKRPPNSIVDPIPRETLINSGWKAIQESKDPAIVAARELVILLRKNEKLGAKLDAQEEALSAELGRALFACYGTIVSPDMKLTHRFSDGVVSGFRSNENTIAPHRATFYGLFNRNSKFDNKYPFNLPKSWLNRKDKIDIATPISFASTNDTTSGNSGSVVVNENLEVVGLNIDGNIESLHNEFLFRNNGRSAVSVHVDGIMESLVKIYDAERVVRELKGQ